MEGMQELLAELKMAEYPIHAFSNYSTWYRLIEESVGLSRYLEWTFVSCHMGIRKPDPQAFRHVASTLQAPPAECLFVDDRQINVDAARGEGMDAILKTDIADLRMELSRRGLITPG
jgi:HAD superfamily hydrolase (TIGR01509 family)